MSAITSGGSVGGSSSGAAWGDITGTLSNQTDLQTALDAKISDPGAVTDNAAVRWDGTGGATVQDSGVLISDLATGYFTVSTANDAVADANPANGITLKPGNKTAGTGNGGEVQIGGGTSTGGERGALRLLGNSTVGNRLCIATQTDNTGFLGYSYQDGGYRRIASAWFGSGLKVGASTSTEIGVDIGKGSNGGYIAFTRSTANTGMSIQTEYNKSMQIYPPSAVDANPVFGFGDWADATRYGVFMLMRSSGAHLEWYTDGAGDIGASAGSRPNNIYVKTNVRVGGNLGVGNSAAATIPGTVTKKIEVFDAAGSSLGFLAVYDAIT